MISLIDQRFDLWNTQQKFDHGTQIDGLNLIEQNELLDKMSNFVLNMRVHLKKNLLPFQKGLFIQYLFFINLHINTINHYLFKEF